MQLHQHTGQGGELLSSRLESFSSLSYCSLWLLSCCEGTDPLGPKSAVTENTLQIASLIRPAAAKIASLNLLSLCLTKNNNNNKKKIQLKGKWLLFYLFVCFLSLTFSKQGLAVLNTADPNFIRLLFKSLSLRIRLYLFCCVNTFLMFN